MPKEKWERQPAIETIANELIAKHHLHLARASVIVLGRPKAATKGGKLVLGTLKAASEKERALFEAATDGEVPPDYVMVIGMNMWAVLRPSEQVALVDHELCHAAGQHDETGKWMTVGHDVEEFGEVLMRHGAWLPELERFVAVAKKVKLPQMSFSETSPEYERA